MEESTQCSQAHLATSKGCFTVDTTQADSVLFHFQHLNSMFKQSFGGILLHPRHLLSRTPNVNPVWHAQRLTSFEKNGFIGMNTIEEVIPCVFMEASAMWQTSPLLAQSSRWKIGWCVSKPTSSENPFEEIFYCAKYLRAILLITYLCLYGYDCTESTWTNVNEWIHEDSRVMCYPSSEG